MTSGRAVIDAKCMHLLQEDLQLARPEQSIEEHIHAVLQTAFEQRPLPVKQKRFDIFSKIGTSRRGSSEVP